MYNASVNVTRLERLEAWNNSTASGAYYLIHGRIYVNAEKTLYQKFKFIVFLDRATDLYDTETETDISERDAVKNMIDGFIPLADSLESENGLYSFIERCNDTIRAYNERNAARRGY